MAKRRTIGLVAALGGAHLKHSSHAELVNIGSQGFGKGDYMCPETTDRKTNVGRLSDGLGFRALWPWI